MAKHTTGPDAYGAVDEAVSALGVARAEAERGSELDTLLVRFQRELFVVGAELATAPDNRRKLEPGVSLVTAAMVAALEPVIDDITSRYDPPTEFVLPGENRIAAALDVARTRRCGAPNGAAWPPPTRGGSPSAPVGVPGGGASEVVPYLNRLADLVYTLARWQEGHFRPVRTT